MDDVNEFDITISKISEEFKGCRGSADVVARAASIIEQDKYPLIAVLGWLRVEFRTARYWDGTNTE